MLTILSVEVALEKCIYDTATIFSVFSSTLHLNMAYKFRGAVKKFRRKKNDNLFKILILLVKFKSVTNIFSVQSNIAYFKNALKFHGD